MSQLKNKPAWLRLCAFLTCAIFTFTNVLFAQRTNLAFREERQLKIGSQNINEKKSLLSSVAPYAEIKEIYSPSLTSSHQPLAPVFIIQDVHENDEAQKNISNIIRQVESTTVVGLEGAWGPLNLSPYRAFADKEIIADIADYFLEKGFIGGPEHAALTSEADNLKLIGVENPALYQKHVKALKESVLLERQVKIEIEKLQEQLRQQKKKVFGPEFLELDSKMSAYHKGNLGLGKYLEYLKAHEHSRTFVNVSLFLDALHLEKTIDFARAEEERNILISSLAAQLPESQINRLVSLSLSYRQGIAGPQFYVYLKSLISDFTHENIQDYPNFSKYVQYAITTGQIRPDKLFQEITRLEDETVTAMAKRSNDSRQILEIYQTSKDLSLVEKLLDYSLTPEEWETYKQRRERIYELGLGLSQVKVFENFFEYAESRNNALVENLLKNTVDGRREKSDGKNNVVLVAGGFHTPGITRNLKQKGLPYVVLTPRITKVEGSGNDYLNVFHRDKTPLEKLFTGERLTLKAIPWTHPDSEFHNVFNRFFTTLSLSSALAKKLKDIPQKQIQKIITQIHEDLYEQLKDEIGQIQQDEGTLDIEPGKTELDENGLLWINYTINWKEKGKPKSVRSLFLLASDKKRNILEGFRSYKEHDTDTAVEEGILQRNGLAFKVFAGSPGFLTGAETAAKTGSTHALATFALTLLVVIGIAGLAIGAYYLIKNLRNHNGSVQAAPFSDFVLTPWRLLKQIAGSKKLALSIGKIILETVVFVPAALILFHLSRKGFFRGQLQLNNRHPPRKTAMTALSQSLNMLRQPIQGHVGFESKTMSVVRVRDLGNGYREGVLAMPDSEELIEDLMERLSPTFSALPTEEATFNEEELRRIFKEGEWIAVSKEDEHSGITYWLGFILRYQKHEFMWTRTNADWTQKQLQQYITEYLLIASGFLPTASPPTPDNMIPGAFVPWGGQSATISKADIGKTRPVVDHEICLNCGRCFLGEGCAHSAVVFRVDKKDTGVHIGFDPKHCTGCASCAETCPVDAIKMVNKTTLNLIDIHRLRGPKGRQIEINGEPAEQIAAWLADTTLNGQTPNGHWKKSSGAGWTQWMGHLGQDQTNPVSIAFLNGGNSLSNQSKLIVQRPRNVAVYGFDAKSAAVAHTLRANNYNVSVVLEGDEEQRISALRHGFEVFDWAPPKEKVSGWQKARNHPRGNFLEKVFSEDSDGKIDVVVSGDSSQASTNFRRWLLAATGLAVLSPAGERGDEPIIDVMLDDLAQHNELFKIDQMTALQLFLKQWMRRWHLIVKIFRWLSKPHNFFFSFPKYVKSESLEHFIGDILLSKKGLSNHDLAKIPEMFMGGHAACPGCGMQKGAYLFLGTIQSLLEQSESGTEIIVVMPGGCITISTTQYEKESNVARTFTAAFSDAPATAMGLASAVRVLEKRGKVKPGKYKVVVEAGDGGTDAALNQLSKLAELNFDVIYFFNNNGFYSNTGAQRSSQTLPGARTASTPVGAEIQGNQIYPKDFVGIMAAHGPKAYVASVSPAYPADFKEKVAKALNHKGFSFIAACTTCNLGLGIDSGMSAKRDRVAVDTGYWPLVEVENGVWTIQSKTKQPVRELYEMGKTFAHLKGDDLFIHSVQDEVDKNWVRLTALVSISKKVKRAVNKIERSKKQREKTGRIPANQAQVPISEASKPASAGTVETTLSDMESEMRAERNREKLRNKSLEFIFYGRGGQGIQLSYGLTSQLVPLLGLFSWASDFYGGQRSQAPMGGYVRIQGKPIDDRSLVTKKDIVIILDETLLDNKPLKTTNGLKQNGIVIINTKLSPEEIRKKYPVELGQAFSVITIDAAALSNEIEDGSQTSGDRYVNTILVGLLFKSLEKFGLEMDIQELEERTKEYFVEEGKFSANTIVANIKALAKGFDGGREHILESKKTIGTETGLKQSPKHTIAPALLEGARHVLSRNETVNFEMLYMSSILARSQEQDDRLLALSRLKQIIRKNTDTELTETAANILWHLDFAYEDKEVAEGIQLLQQEENRRITRIVENLKAGATKVIKGMDAVALAWKQVKPGVISVFPITPQTGVVTEITRMHSNGELLAPTEILQPDVEYSVFAALKAASSAGVRTVSATSSHGVAFAYQELVLIAAARVPAVITIASRTVFPESIVTDREDVMSLIDQGYIIFFAKPVQEAYDMQIIAQKTAETLQTPVIVALDGWVTSHAEERINILPQEKVDQFVGEFNPQYSLLMPSRPRALTGPLVGSDRLMEFRAQQETAIQQTEVIKKIMHEYADISGRAYDYSSQNDLIENYRMDDAEEVVVALAYTGDLAKLAVDELRTNGKKAGLLRIKSLRPFPVEDVRKALRGKKAVGVLDKSGGYGSVGGPAFREVAASLQGLGEEQPLVRSYIFGLGDRTFGVEEIEKIFDDLTFLGRNGKTNRENQELARQIINVSPEIKEELLELSRTEVSRMSQRVKLSAEDKKRSVQATLEGFVRSLTERDYLAFQGQKIFIGVLDDTRLSERKMKVVQRIELELALKLFEKGEADFDEAIAILESENLSFPMKTWMFARARHLIFSLAVKGNKSAQAYLLGESGNASPDSETLRPLINHIQTTGSHGDNLVNRLYLSYQGWAGLGSLLAAGVGISILVTAPWSLWALPASSFILAGFAASVQFMMTKFVRQVSSIMKWLIEHHVISPPGIITEFRKHGTPVEMLQPNKPAAYNVKTGKIDYLADVIQNTPHFLQKFIFRHEMAHKSLKSAKETLPILNQIFPSLFKIDLETFKETAARQGYDTYKSRAKLNLSGAMDTNNRFNDLTSPQVENVGFTLLSHESDELRKKGAMPVLDTAGISNDAIKQLLEFSVNLLIKRTDREQPGVITVIAKDSSQSDFIRRQFNSMPHENVTLKISRENEAVKNGKLNLEIVLKELSLAKFIKENDYPVTLLTRRRNMWDTGNITAVTIFELMGNINLDETNETGSEIITDWIVRRHA